MTDRDYMHKALQLALKAKGCTSPNPMVGALVVKNNRIIAEGFHRYCGGDHAEIIALREAKAQAKGATLYLTLEPCFHFGRTPPCVDAIIKAGIKHVVIGMKDPNPLTNGRSINKLKKAGVKVTVGVLENELRQANEVFIKYISSRLPFVVAKCAQTLDGKIATANGRSKWITSGRTRDFARNLRNDFDAILVGINTVLKDDPRLNAPHKAIKKIILDQRLRIKENAKLLKGVNPANCFIATTAKADRKKLKRFEHKGMNIIVCPTKNGLINLRWLLRALARKEIVSILIEGGAHVIGSALKGDLVDKMHIYIAPKILGSQKALSSIDGLKADNINQSLKLKDVSFQKIGEDFFLQGYVHRHR